MSAICTLFQRNKKLGRARLKSDVAEIRLSQKLRKIRMGLWFKKPGKYFPVCRNRICSKPGGLTLRKILWSFHTNWALKKIAERRRIENTESEPIDLTTCKVVVPTSKNIGWFGDILRYFAPAYRQPLIDHFGPMDFDIPRNSFPAYIRTVVDIGAKEMTELSNRLFLTIEATSRLAEAVRSAVAAKRGIADLLELESARIASTDPTLDEGNIWGLKPLRRFLTPPYFKSELLAGPAHPSAIYIAEQCQDPFFNFNKQKWTTKDLHALRQSVREALIEKGLLQIQMRTDVLIYECQRIHDREKNQKLLMQQMGKVIEPNPKNIKRPGRPKKSWQSPHLGTIAPHLFTINARKVGPIVVRASVTNNHVEEWRDKEEDKLNKLDLTALLKLHKGIEWVSVSNTVSAKTKKDRSPEDCLWAFQCEGDPGINSKRWSPAETKALKEVVQKLENRNWRVKNAPVGVDWNKALQETGNGRTPYQCFYRWRNTIAPVDKMHWNADKDTTITNIALLTEGNWKKVAVICGDELTTKKQVIDRYKKNCNPMLRAGPFSRVEDALLLVTLEKLKGHLRSEGHFGELIAYLPWRFETVWRDRAGNLFSDWIVPWTIEEDRRLLDLAISKKRNWREIADSFDSFKNRKGCLTRWKILKKRLATFKDLEEYHEAYSMIRYNVFQYQHLKELLILLRKVVKEPQSPFKGLRPSCPPQEEDLQDFLLSFDRVIMISTIKSLEDYINARDILWKDQVEVSNDKKRTFDRRTYNPEIPQSVASALHIRGIKLIPKNDLKIKLNAFEDDIYKFYARFSRTKPLKKGTKRPYLPPAAKLKKLDTTKRIIQQPKQKILSKRRK